MRYGKYKCNYELKCEKCFGVSENLSFKKVSYQYVLAVRLKQICRASTLALSTTVGVEPQTTTLDITNHNRSL